MNIKIIFIISLFALILANVTICASYAESSEKICTSSTSYIKTFDKKIVSIVITESWDEVWNFKRFYRINIQKTHQSKYKIQSVKCKFRDSTDKTYDGKNKNSLAITPSKYDDHIESMTINYQTKGKIKSELEKKLYQQKGKLLSESVFVGKKSKVKLEEKGHFDDTGQGFHEIKSRKFNIKTNNKKIKIKTVKVMYFDIMENLKSITFNGNGKTTFVKEGSFDEVEHFYAFQITYY